MRASPPVVGIAFIAAGLALIQGACSKNTNASPDGTSSSSSSSSSGGDDDSGAQTEDSSPGRDGQASSKVKVTNETVDVDGTSRTYVLVVPKSYVASRKYPLIVGLHGDGQDGAGFEKELGLDALTGDDAIIAYPDHSEDLFTAYADNNDQRLIEVVIGAIPKKFSIDPAKIWGIGYSKGAYQLNQIACRKPGLIKAMALHAGGAPQDRDPTNEDVVSCPGVIGLPAFVTHGGADEPAGGEFEASYWAGVAGCKDTRSATSPAICEKYDGCPAATPVVFCVVPNQPHYPLYDDAAKDSWNWFKTL